jgi:hypothetical protein
MPKFGNSLKKTNKDRSSIASEALRVCRELQDVEMMRSNGASKNLGSFPMPSLSDANVRGLQFAPTSLRSFEKVWHDVADPEQRKEVFARKLARLV